MDILILLAALSLGQLLGFHIYRRSGGLPPGLVIAAFAAILFLFALFTVAPSASAPVSGQYDRRLWDPGRRLMP